MIRLRPSAGSREVVATGLVRITGIGLYLLTTLVLARLYGPEALGIYALALPALMLITSPVGRGWGTVLLRQSAGETYNRSWQATPLLLARGRKISMAVAGAALCVGLIVVYVDRRLIPGEQALLVVGCFCATLLADQISALRMSLVRGFGYTSIAVIPETVLRPAVLVATLWVLFRLEPGRDPVSTVFVALAVAAWFSLGLGEVLLRLLVKRVSYLPDRGEERFREWSSAALVIAANTMLFVVFANVGVFVLGSAADLPEVGVYKLATQLALFSGFCYATLNIVVAHRFSSLLARGDMVELSRVGARYARLSFLGALPVPLVLLLWGKPLVALVFGPEFVPAVTPAIILCLGELVSAGVGMAAMLLTMSGREGTVIRHTFRVLVLQIVLAVPLTLLFGATGAAVAMAVSASCLNLAYLDGVRSALGVDISILGGR